IPDASVVVFLTIPLGLNCGFPGFESFFLQYVFSLERDQSRIRGRAVLVHTRFCVGESLFLDGPIQAIEDFWALRREQIGGLSLRRQPFPFIITATLLGSSLPLNCSLLLQFG